MALGWRGAGVAILMRRGETLFPAACIAERRSTIPPHAFGEAIEVPFISWRLFSVQVGTGAIAPPGAETETSSAPSAVGPLDDHVYCMSSSLARKEYCGPIMLDDAKAPTAIVQPEVPGAPPVVKAGPLLPAEVTKTMPYLCTAFSHICVKRPASSRSAYSPNERLMMWTPRSMATPSALTSALPVSIEPSLGGEGEVR